MKDWKEAIPSVEETMKIEKDLKEEKERPVIGQRKILEVVVRDLVDFSIQAKKVLQLSNIQIKDAQEALLLDKMCDEILLKYTRAGKNE